MRGVRAELESTEETFIVSCLANKDSECGEKNLRAKKNNMIIDTTAAQLGERPLTSSSGSVMRIRGVC